MNPLLFFDKEGNSLNYNYNEELERYEGDILFHENSSDTHKTQALYLFEKVSGFEYENPGSLTIRRFQLFNEKGFHFYRGTDSYQIDRIEPVNEDSDYYSKWIYGENFDSIFRKGSFIRFDSSIFEFTVTNVVYSVVGSKKGAILILSLVDNDTFETTYGLLYTDPTSYVGKTISAVNLIGFYDYIRPPFQTQLSYWNEIDFSGRFYVDRKLNIVNTQLNDEYIKTKKFEDVDVVTVRDVTISDGTHFQYSLSGWTASSDLIIEVISRRDLPLIYQGGLIFDSINGVVNFDEEIPSILKPGTEFQVRDSTLNNFFLNVSSIQSFLGNSQMTYYATGSQVIWDNRIYQCLQAYTWSGGMTESIIPDGKSISVEYWGPPTYLPIDQTLTSETLAVGNLYLTTDHLYFVQPFTQSAIVTMASAADRFRTDFRSLDIDLFFENEEIKADLIYPSQYAIVNYYPISITYSEIGTQSQFSERLIETYEELNREFNYDFAENFNYNIVFTDMDESGMTIEINNMNYQTETSFIYSSGVIDMERTIDRTLRIWISRNFLSLVALGLIPTLLTIGSNSPYYNSINIRTEYPNVPIKFEVRVGITANFYIEHSLVVFYDMGSYINVEINDRSYGQNFDTDIPTTLQNWVDEWYDIVEDYGILVTHQASSLRFDIRDQNKRLNLNINVGKSSLPGIDNYKIIRRLFGNHGALITSNEIVEGSSSVSFETSGFSTGQIIGINQTFYPLQNIEFNCLFLDPQIVNLSYEGPFWGLTSSECSTSAMSVISFNVGFGQTACAPAFLPDLYRGMYDNLAFDESYSIEYYITNTYSVVTIPSGIFTNISNMVDIEYIQPINYMYVLGDTVGVFDSISSEFIEEISFPYTGPITLIYNQVDSYVYVLTSDYLVQIDPFVNQVTLTYSISSPIGMSIDTLTGNVYVSFGASNVLEIYDSNSLVDTVSLESYQMAFNYFEGDMYVVGSGVVYRVNGDDFGIQATYVAPGVGSGSSIVYDLENESIYVSSGANVYHIDNGTVSTISPAISGVFDMMFNNLNSSINISTTGNDLISLGVDDDQVLWSTPLSGYGYISLNKFDGSIYISDQSSNNCMVIDSMTGSFLTTITFSAQTNRLSYNPDRTSIWLIQPSTTNLIEILSNLNSNFIIDTSVNQGTGEEFYGTLDSNYINRNYLWVHTREYIRKPRDNFNGESIVSLYWKWYSDNVPEFFLYDFSGDQLPTDGIFAYTGPKPLETVYLNKKPNRDVDKVAMSEYQQTVFDVIEIGLDYIDDGDNFSIVPEPLQVFIGYNSPDEGALRSILQLYKKEDIDFTISPLPISDSNIITFEHIETDFDRYGRISLDVNSSEFFNDRGFKIGQHLVIFIRDITNSKKQYVSENNGYLVKIRSVYSKSIEVDYFKSVDKFVLESNVISNFPKSGKTTYLSIRFKVWDKEIGRFNVYGQTEIEDIRYHIELNNVGKLISSDDIYIFKDYDIKEEGIDWVFLNKKRKEMLMMRNLIYPYIGSYKSIVNAINHFGYNDLELYEYYRNINVDSPNYMKLFKVEIPDIFDNTVDGWTENDFIKHTFPNSSYEDTNLFNLTFRITDKEGNNILQYTLREIQIKLQGLKYWLQKNIIPITHKILDITGRADFAGVIRIDHLVRDVSIFNVYQDFTPVTFELNEAYLMPVNNGSTVYNCVLDFSLGSEENIPDYYTIDIRAYEIYREWYPFKNYGIGDRVIYYNRAYESKIINNKTNNPRKFENASLWESGTSYNVADAVMYQRDIYVFTGQSGATSSIIAPSIDSSDWLEVTEWKEVDLQPVDTISEWRPISNLMPFNFTIDSNISPYLIISVNTSNGYGMNFSDRKNYEIRGILDIRELEAFSNLTSKQYRMSLPIVSP